MLLNRCLKFAFAATLALGAFAGSAPAEARSSYSFGIAFDSGYDRPYYGYGDYGYRDYGYRDYGYRHYGERRYRPVRYARYYDDRFYYPSRYYDDRVVVYDTYPRRHHHNRRYVRYW